MSEEIKKPFFITRCLAFVIDAFLVLLVASLLSVPFVNVDKLNTVSEQSKELVEKYQAKEITDQEYVVEASNIQYMMARNMEIVSVFGLLIAVLYYVVLPLYNKGQTIGKKLLGLRIASTVGDLYANQLLFRSFIANFILLNFISILFLIFASRSIYTQCVEIFTIIQYSITFVSIIMIIINKDGLALHDRLVHTKVIKVK